MSIESKVQAEIDKITGQESKRTPIRNVGSTGRVGKSALRKTAERFLDADIDDIKKDVEKGFRKKLLSFIGDTLHLAIDQTFRQRPSNGSGYGSSIVRTYDNPSYKDYSSVKRNGVSTPVASNKYSFADLRFTQRSNAQNLLDAMKEAIACNGSVTVTEMYDALDDPSSLEPTDGYFGWTNLDSAYIKEDGGLYRLYLPPVVSFK